jgi:hypothetical protein
MFGGGGRKGFLLDRETEGQGYTRQGKIKRGEGGNQSKQKN